MRKTIVKHTSAKEVRAKGAARKAAIKKAEARSGGKAARKKAKPKKPEQLPIGAWLRSVRETLPTGKFGDFIRSVLDHRLFGPHIVTYPDFIAFMDRHFPVVDLQTGHMVAPPTSQYRFRDRVEVYARGRMTAKSRARPWKLGDGKGADWHNRPPQPARNPSKGKPDKRGKLSETAT